jgi:hypothetical protein
MAKEAEDQKTDGKGNEAGQEGAPGTATGQEGEGQEKTAEQIAADKVVADKAAADKAAADEAAAKADKKFNQADVDRIVQERLDREKKKASGEFKALYEEETTKREAAERRAAELETERKAARTQERTNLQVEIDALPEEVKAMAPDLKAKGGIEKVRGWLPTAQKLAEKLGAAGKMPGNGGDPKPLGAPGDTKTADELTKKASQHSIYR